MNRKYRAYREAPAVTCLLDERAEAEQREKGLLRADAELLWEIEVATTEEAAAIYHLRMGFEPFEPMGEWQPCPECGAVYYPEHSGECWRCGFMGG